MSGADHRIANEDLGLDVDVLILEYLAHQATAALLWRSHALIGGLLNNGSGRQHAKRPRGDIKDHVAMVDGFHKYFRRRHSTYQPQPLLHFRLQLVKFFALYVTRDRFDTSTITTQSLGQLRRRNRLRAEEWHSLYEGRSTDDWRHKIAKRPVDDLWDDADSADTQPNTRPELMDLLPLFIQLTALRSALGSTSSSTTAAAGTHRRKRKRSSSSSTSSQESTSSFVDDWAPSYEWLKLSADMMFHAAAERLINTGTSHASPILEAFAWGPCTAIVGQLPDSELHSLFEIGDNGFGGKDSSGSTAFDMLRHDRVMRLLGATKISQLLSRFPQEHFELSMLYFLEALFEDLEEPFLTQLDTADSISVDGITLSKAEAYYLRRVTSEQ